MWIIDSIDMADVMFHGIFCRLQEGLGVAVLIRLLRVWILGPNFRSWTEACGPQLVLDSTMQLVL